MDDNEDNTRLHESSYAELMKLAVDNNGDKLTLVNLGAHLSILHAMDRHQHDV
jgi:hypothetical protein